MNIQEFCDQDVLCGRGALINNHVGNFTFRYLVHLNKEKYFSSHKVQRQKLAQSLVRAIRNQNPPGRFLKQDPQTRLWNDIGDKRAIQKTKQALRERPSKSARNSNSSNLENLDISIKSNSEKRTQSLIGKKFNSYLPLRIELTPYTYQQQCKNGKNSIPAKRQETDLGYNKSLVSSNKCIHSLNNSRGTWKNLFSAYSLNSSVQNSSLSKSDERGFQTENLYLPDTHDDILRIQQRNKQQLIFNKNIVETTQSQISGDCTNEIPYEKSYEEIDKLIYQAFMMDTPKSENFLSCSNDEVDHCTFKYTQLNSSTTVAQTRKSSYNYLPSNRAA